MRAFQRKLRLTFVIERGGFPGDQVMAGGAIDRLTRRRELISMDVFMAAFTRGRRFAEHDSLDALREIRGLVTFQARRRSMRALQFELGGVVVEGAHFFPGTQAVAGFALLKRAFLELALMRILMAFEAGQGFKMIFRCRGRIQVRRLMTIRARRSGVAAIQRESRLLVVRLAIGGWTKSFHGMAIVAAIRKFRRGELTAVRVLMAVRTGIEFDAIDCAGARGDVTFRAFDGLMLPLQRITAIFVTGDGKRCVLEAALVVTGGAIAILKLALMRIGLVAGVAAVMRHGLAEIVGFVALEAIHLSVQFEQGIFGPAVIESSGGVYLLPSVHVVATLTGGLESASMRVAMAIDACGERDVPVLNVSLRIRSVDRFVALLAGDLGGVQSRELEPGRGVFEARCRLPAFDGMAFCAIRS